MLLLRHNDVMASITIRNVPDDARDELASRPPLRAGRCRVLRTELIALAARPSVEAWLESVRDRKRATATTLSAVDILDDLGADRR